MFRIVDKLIDHYRSDGLAATARLIAKNISYEFNHLIRSLRGAGDAPDEFDDTYGTDTAGIVELRKLAIESNNARHGVRYQPSSATLFDKALSKLDIKFDEYTFIDFGCGKGKVLLLASHYPFKKIIGVEFSGELSDIARNNISIYRDKEQKCGNFEVVNADAAEFEIPHENTVLYFYNPFDNFVMDMVIENIKTHVKYNNKNAYIVYIEPEHRKLLDDSPEFATLFSEDGVVIFGRR